MSIQTLTILALLTIFSCYLMAQLIKNLFELLAKLSALFAIGFLGLIVLAFSKDFLDKETNFSNNLDTKSSLKMSQDEILIPSMNNNGEKVINSELGNSRSEKIIVEHHVYFKDSPDQSPNKHIFPIINENPSNNIKKKAQLEIAEELNNTLYCDQFDLTTPRFVLIESFFAEEDNAKKRVEFLTNKGLGTIQYIWVPCFQSNLNKDLFAVLLGRTCRTERSIKAKQKKYEVKAQKIGIKLISNTYKFLERPNHPTYF